ncbi:hypothetical protein IW261DRAFT_1558999 [Armillaria novae-zelandiae]|uniref:DUF6534 domain-containing protein n=1 Tax=Armillaria novae-zelandiae TaxID=153914 RepID=A0AA39PQ39_9AGAR|nr:hypothetical protein IW261DRAFT_1558999 [Armillaria novae-zelandiae]
MDSAAVVIPSLGTTIGAALVGAMLSSLLFGITVLQAFIYYRDYPNDWKLYRYSVGILWVLDAFHLSLTIHAIYHYTVDSFGNFAALGNVVWSFKVRATLGLVEDTSTNFVIYLFQLQILVNVIIIVFVQRCDLPIHSTILATHPVSLSVSMQYGYGDVVRFVDSRVLTDSTHTVGRHFHRFLPWIVIFVVACGFAVGVLLVYKTFACRLSRFLPKVNAVTDRYSIKTFTGLASMDWAIDAAFATSTGIDFFISFAMCYYLHRSRSISEFSSTNSRLLVLMWFVLMSGLATSACSTIALITYIALPNTLIFLGVEFLLTKLYVNSLLSMLNARKRLQGANTGSGTALSEPTSFSNVIRLTPTAGPGASVADVKRGGFEIPLSEMCGSAPLQNNEDFSPPVEDKRSRAGLSVV